MSLWQDPFCQVPHERASPIFHGKHGVALFSIYGQMVGFTLGLNQVHVFAYIWLVETRSMQPLVQANLLANPASPAVHLL